MNCPWCNLEILEDSVKCPECGGIVRCAGCGHEINPGDTYSNNHRENKPGQTESVDEEKLLEADVFLEYGAPLDAIRKLKEVVDENESFIPGYRKLITIYDNVLKNSYQKGLSENMLPLAPEQSPPEKPEEQPEDKKDPEAIAEEIDGEPIESKLFEQPQAPEMKMEAGTDLENNVAGPVSAKAIIEERKTRKDAIRKRVLKQINERREKERAFLDEIYRDKRKKKRRQMVDIIILAIVMLVAGVLFMGKIIDLFEDKNQLTAMEIPGMEYISCNYKGFHEYRNIVDGSMMVLLPGGKFRMGTDRYEAHSNEKPAHDVELGMFLIDKYEVTVEQFRKFCTARNKKLQEQPDWNGDKHPVVIVSWNDALAYSQWAGKRVPTEAEWEYSHRSGARKKIYPWGNKFDPGKGNHHSRGNMDGHLYTAPVGSFDPNNFGLYDMGGNVWEWCADWYDKNYYTNCIILNPSGSPVGEFRVMRGGSWLDKESDMRNTRRQYDIACQLHG